MCGIAGIIDFKKTGKAQEALKLMMNALEHRGPDDNGSTKLTFQNGWEIFLGHQRLSIIDLSINAHQPMSNHKKTHWIVLNGEIYNYRELKQNLKHKYSFLIGF